MSILGLNRTEFRLLADEILGHGHKVRFQASGESMQPFIQNGDILEVAPLAGRHIQPGDVLLVDAGSERLLVHRVIKAGHQGGNPRYLVKGDNSSSADGWFQMENCLGRVEIVERRDWQYDLTSTSHRWKSRMWVTVAPWTAKFSWLPKKFREWLRRIFLLN